MTDVRLNKANRYAVALARFANQCGITVRDAATLATLADRAFRDGERARSIDDEAVQRAGDKACRQFNAAAANLGLTPIWPGLWPIVQKDCRNIEIPAQ